MRYHPLSNILLALNTLCIDKLPMLSIDKVLLKSADKAKTMFVFVQQYPKKEGKKERSMLSWYNPLKIHISQNHKLQD